MSQQPEFTPLSASPVPQPGVNEPISGSGSQAGLGVPGGAEQGTVPPVAAHHHSPQRIPRWLERAELFLRVLLRLYIGLAVCYAPWSHMFWDQNPLFQRYPAIGMYAANGAVRGIISGLGLLNLWIAFRDAIRHRDG